MAAAPTYRDTILSMSEPETERLVNSDDEPDPVLEKPGHGAKSASKSRPLRFFILLCKCCVYLLALYGLLDLCRRMHDHLSPEVQRQDTTDHLALAAQQQQQEQQQDASCSCGETLASALALDCKFDVLSSAWLPPRCRDDIVTAEFEHAGPGPGGAWTYFEDENGTIPIDVSKLGELTNTGRKYHATNVWHMIHCFYFWKKQYRVRFTGVVVERWGDTEPHIDHCIGLFHKYPWKPVIGSVVEPMLPNPPFRHQSAQKSNAE
ncbi:hypothetical protein L13192_04202 [Pyrenophora tritici-repentis]|uniref:Uncharacterized protein n=2 Tax=Pyrenophora tritici-repentis TaxID=45151 RepID=A0A922SX34_9PLEO|nr:uncharacterized protein PTRG_10161 [Pyrenophora tritici-repentis Pt-1C-BFP]EDU43212.1 conserved hypothetical protein [Pyrenophora tritici-repentis Pt-1C-BFP]KAI1509608.1 hypothetical protein Ptr86124_011688 [Pyrenophora tritici-repentis]KAI1670845.1 hypothetical protein L13192_04202 [Pyrenophora tritici-repentis]